MRAQVDQARRRRYPTTSDAPAKWLNLIAGKLATIRAQLSGPVNSREKAESLLVDLVSCYDDLQILARADTTQVADFVVSALHRWFIKADDDCDYLFASGINFEVEPLYDAAPPDLLHEDHLWAAEQMKKVLYRITMPGGALGAGFHIPLVAHEVGHVLMFRLDRESANNLTSNLFGDSENEIYRNWVKEIIADTLCGFVAGPAGFFSLYEKLRGAGDIPDDEYPHNCIRLSSLGDFIHRRFDGVLKSCGVNSRSWSNWKTCTTKELLTIPYSDYSGDYTDLSHRLIKELPRIRNVALKIGQQCLSDIEYTPEQTKRDLKDHLESFLNAIPPFETNGDLRKRRPTELASILNLGWFIAAFAMPRLKITTTYKPMEVGQMLLCLDQLVLKAIELSEIKRQWIGT